ncbi:relaxin receptor 1-like [Asterias rubens]|uniref:relaxin receptor 1-like n=1 Tax=Asterias rubens TaxID=7604 RepID=UPI001455A19E|nr:relaxin receptor 1-like [Asterias rubens]
MTQLCSLEHHDHAVRLLHQRMTCVNTLFQTDGLTKRPIQTCLRCLLLSSGNRWIPTGFVVMRECTDSPRSVHCRDAAQNAPVYNCLDSIICVPYHYFCDNYVDCDTEEDELNCDQQYVTGCHFGALQMTCSDVTLNASYGNDVPNNIRFISLDGVHTTREDADVTVTSLVNLTRFPYVVKLYLINNNITEVNLGREGSLPYLMTADLSKNNIRSLEATSFLASPGIVHLDLSQNYISYIDPAAFRHLSLLTEISLRDNLIHTLNVNTFRGLSKLEVINISHNDIQDLEPGLFDNLKNLTSLNILENSMTSLRRGTFRGLSQLTQLIIADIPLRYIEQGAFQDLTSLISLQLSGNNLELIYAGTFQELTSLTHLVIVKNSISTLQPGVFKGLHSLESMNLVNNNITEIEPGAFNGLDNIVYLDLGNNSFSELRAGTFSGMPNLQILQMAYVPLEHIEPRSFQGLPNLLTLNILQAKLKSPSQGMLNGINNLSSISTSDYRLCCLLDPAWNASCIGPSKSFSSCERLMPNYVLRIAIWLLGISAIFGNIFVIGKRATKKRRRDVTVQGFLITHLAISDAMMGLYMIGIGVADSYFSGNYFLHSERWRSGGWCKTIGLLSMLSAEASVFLVMLISLDRFVSIAFPFSRFKLEIRSVRVYIAVAWIIAFALSLTGTIMAGSSPSFYGLSDVCVGLPLITSPVNGSSTWIYSRKTGTYVYEVVVPSTKPAWGFSVFLYIGLNFFCFVVVLICYVAIFVIVRRSSRSVAQRGTMARKPCNGTSSGAKSQRSASFSREVKLATRMALVVGTDFCCWMPIIIMGILTQSGTITVPDELYAWTVVFILPINSSLNPYLYTISEMWSKRKKKGAGYTQCIRMNYSSPGGREHDRNNVMETDTVGITQGSS